MDFYNKPPVTLLYLAHHGIKGQKWGVRNGPPYPLGASDHSASEKKAGWRSSLDKGGGRGDNKKRSGRGASEQKMLTSGEKKSIVIGAKAAEAALATYGKHKLSSVETFKNSGQKLVGDILDEMGDKPARDFKHAPEQKATETGKGFKRLAEPESLEDTLAKTNPLRGSDDGENNCVLSAIAGFMRQAGYDVTAGSTPGREPMNPGGVVEECFRGAKIIEGSATKFAKSRQDATEMLLKRFGPNAQGICCVQWKQGGGHAFSWTIVDGAVSFFDCQQGKDDDYVSRYFKLIDPTGNLTLARLDGLDVDMEAISKYVRRG